MSRFDINYVITTPDEDINRASPLQGFSNPLLERRGWIRTILRRCPPNALEAAHFSERCLQLRIAGLAKYCIFPLISGELPRLRATAQNPFWILFIDESTRSDATAWQREQQLPVMLIESPPEGEEPTEPTWNGVMGHCIQVSRYIADHDLNAEGPDILAMMQNATSRESFDIPFDFYGHNTTIPNELALLSIGGAFRGTGERLEGKDDLYTPAILQSADGVAYVRSQIPFSKIYKAHPPMSTLIVTCPGIYRHVRKMDRPKSHKSKHFFEMLQAIRAQTTFSMYAEDEDMRRLMSQPESQLLLQWRSFELAAFSDALAIRAASHLCPVIRLPPKANHISPALSRLANCVRGSKPSLQKLRKITDVLYAELSAAIDPDAMKRIDQPQVGVKIVADVPLEWTPIRGLPIMLRHVTSRIPVTPGNLAFTNILPHDQLDLSMEDFRQTLVIRAFDDDDPLRKDLETAIEAYRLSDGRSMPVRIVDVKDAAELVSALASFDGALAIYDGHGVHRNSDDIGVLPLPKEKVNLWEIRKEARMPPIFFACGCDTHAMDRSHVTTANALLAGGARAVIAGALPILSKPAAIFAARLLYRVYEFMPIVTNVLRHSIRWDWVFSTMQRMVFVSELMRVLEATFDNAESWALAVQTHATSIIQSSGDDWYEQFLDHLAEASGHSIEEIEEARSRQLPFPEILKYVHLGNPESIVIHPADFEPNDYRD